MGRYLVGDFVAFCFAVVAVGLIYQKKKKKVVAVPQVIVTIVACYRSNFTHT